jgi:hypothetical protein
MNLVKSHISCTVLQNLRPGQSFRPSFCDITTAKFLQRRLVFNRSGPGICDGVVWCMIDYPNAAIWATD